MLPLTNPDYADTHIPPNWAKGLWAQFCEGFIPERHTGGVERRDGQVYYNGKKIAATRMRASSSSKHSIASSR